jgi:hypothetical protein
VVDLIGIDRKLERSLAARPAGSAVDAEVVEALR